MLNKDDIITYIRENDDYLKNHFHLSKIGLFGSFARGEETQNSDIDLLIEIEPKTENIYTLKRELKELFAAEFGRDIDIAREKYLKEYVKDSIINETIYVE